MLPSGTDGWRWNTNEAALNLRPVLEVSYTPEPASTAWFALAAGSTILRRRRRG
jgi:hypothetical protein